MNTASEEIRDDLEVSVVIPVFNGGTMLDRQLDSLDAQEGAPRFEVVVSDNGTTDGSVERARSRSTGPEVVVVDASSKVMPTSQLWLAIGLLMFVLPAAVAWAVSFWLYKTGRIQLGDMKLTTI